MLDTQRLLTFAAVIRTGSFAAAARELGYTQPGVSQQMRALERGLGADLFVRSGRGLKLSVQGEVLAGRAEALLADIKATEERINAVSRLRNGRVRVCAFPSANATLVPKALSTLRAEQLGLEVELFEQEPPDSLDGLGRGDHDVVVAFHYGDQHPAEQEGEVTITLLEEPLVLLLPDSHPFARRKQIELKDLSDERWVAGCVRCREEFVRACSEAGFEPRIDVTTDDNLAVQSQVVAGLGLAVMPNMVQSFVRHPRLRTRALLPVRKRVITATYLAARGGSPAVNQMLRALRRAADEMSLMPLNT
jgi:DNA-binding transcriptional LysR family regulator